MYGKYGKAPDLILKYDKKKHWKAIKVKEQHLQSLHKENICRVNFHPKEFLL